MIVVINLREKEEVLIENIEIECNGERRSTPHPSSIVSAVRKSVIKNALGFADKLRANDNVLMLHFVKSNISSLLNKKIEEYGLKIEISDVDIEKSNNDSFIVKIPVEEIDYGKTVIKLLPLLSQKPIKERRNKILSILKIISEEKRIKIINSVFEHLDDSEVEKILVAVVENYNEKICEGLTKLLKKSDIGYEIEKITLEI